MGYFYDLWDDFISLLFPRLCNGCGNHLLRNEELICTECYIAIPRTNFHLKDENPVARLFWGRCLVEKAASFSFYTRDSRIRRMIHQLKYKGVKELGPELGRIYARSLKSSGFLEGIDLIVPVPLHPARLRKRGFNQSELIAGGISEVSGIRIESLTLKRIRSTATQTKKTRYDRWKNMEGIFRADDIQKLKGCHVLLVDDVITTGSTIESCVNEILKAEGAKVSVVVLAYAVIT